MSWQDQESFEATRDCGWRFCLGGEGVVSHLLKYLRGEELETVTWGVLAEFTGFTVTIRRVGDGRAILFDQGGYPLAPSGVMELIRCLENAYQEVTDDDIALMHRRITELHRRITERHGARSREPLPPKAAPKPQRGYVYLVRADNGLYKIGKTKTIEPRIKALTIELPYGLEVIHTIATGDMNALESRFHNIFSEKRVRGEWFRLDDDDVKYIRERCDD